MVGIPWQYLSGADKAVLLRRSVFVDKEAKPELRHNKIEIALSIRISDFPFAWPAAVKNFLKIFNVAYILCIHNRAWMS